MKLASLNTVLVAAILFSMLPVHSATHIVDATSNWSTVMSSVVDGDTVQVRTSAAAPVSVGVTKCITIENYPGDLPILDGNSAYVAIQFLSGSTGSVVRGLTFNNYNSALKQISATIALTIEDCVFENVSYSLTATVTVENCSFTGGTYALSSCPDSVVRNSSFVNVGACAKNSPNVSFDGCTFTADQSSKRVVETCNGASMTNCETTGWQYIFVGSSDVIVSNTLFRDCSYIAFCNAHRLVGNSLTFENVKYGVYNSDDISLTTVICNGGVYNDYFVSGCNNAVINGLTSDGMKTVMSSCNNAVLINAVIRGAINYSIAGGLNVEIYDSVFADGQCAASSNTDILFNRCVFDNLTTSTNWGAFYHGDGEMVNCTFVNNNAVTVYTETDDSLIFDSCIFWNNTRLNNALFSSNVLVQYSLLPNVDRPETEIVEELPYVCGEGNVIGSDPLFVDASSGDYRLASGSPCIDAGNPLFAVPAGGGSIVDMGAYEYTHISPVIIQHPISQTAQIGESVSFSVIAESNLPLFYQWRFNGIDISEADASVLIIPEVSISDYGQYDCVVSNANGSVVSNTAVLDYIDDLIIDHRENHDWVSVIQRAVSGDHIFVASTAPVPNKINVEKMLSFTCDPINTPQFNGGGSAEYALRFSISANGSEINNLILSSYSQSALTGVDSILVNLNNCQFDNCNNVLRISVVANACIFNNSNAAIMNCNSSIFNNCEFNNNLYASYQSDNCNFDSCSFNENDYVFTGCNRVTIDTCLISNSISVTTGVQRITIKNSELQEISYIAFSGPEKIIVDSCLFNNVSIGIYSAASVDISHLVQTGIGRYIISYSDNISIYDLSAENMETFFSSCNNITISRAMFSNCKDERCRYIIAGSSNVEIEYTTISEGNYLAFCSCENVELYRVTMYDYYRNSSLQNASAFYQTSVNALNCTFSDMEKIVSYQMEGQDIHFDSCIMHNISDIIHGSILADISVKYSLITNRDISLTNEEKALLDLEANHCLSVPVPGFSNPSARDYNLLSDSPAIDAGNPLIVVPESYGTIIDMGANEYYGPSINGGLECIWVGNQTDNSWENPLNWLSQTIPTENDIVIFNNQAMNDCIINSDISVLGFSLSESFYRTVFVSNTNDVDINIGSCGYSQYAGIFNANTSKIVNITVYGTFDFIAGEYISTNEVLRISSDVNILPEANFYHNLGTLELIPIAAARHELSTGGQYLCDLTIVAFDSSTLYVSGVVPVDGDLSLDTRLNYQNNRINGGTLLVHGSVIVNSNLFGSHSQGAGTATIKMAGLGDQHIIGNEAGYLPNLNIEKNSGTLYLEGTFAISGDFIHTLGSVDAGNSTVIFAAPISELQTITSNISLPIYYNNLTICGFGLSTQQLINPVYVNGLLAFDMRGETKNKVNGGPIHSYGDITMLHDGFGTASDGPGDTYILVEGIADQTIYGNAAGHFPEIRILKQSGSLFLDGTIYAASDWYENNDPSVTTDPQESTVVFWACASDNFIIDTATMHFNNAMFYGYNASTHTLYKPITLEGDLTFNMTSGNNALINGETVNVWGNLYMNSANWGTGPNTPGTSTININGQGSQTLYGNTLGVFPNITINKLAGELLLSGQIVVSGNWNNYAVPVLSPQDSRVVFLGVSNKTQIICEPQGLNNVDIVGNNNSIHSIDTELWVLGDLLFRTVTNAVSGNSINGGTIFSEGDVKTLDDGLTGSAVISFVGDKTQVCNASEETRSGSLIGIIINKIDKNTDPEAGKLFFHDTLNIHGDVTFVSGDVAYHNNIFVFDGIPSSVSINMSGRSIGRILINAGSQAVNIISDLGVSQSLEIIDSTAVSFAVGTTIGLGGNLTADATSSIQYSDISICGVNDQIVQFEANASVDTITVNKVSGNLRFLSGFEAATLSLKDGSRIEFLDTATYLLGVFNAEYNENSHYLLRSSTAGEQFDFNVTTPGSVQSVDVSDCNSNGGSTIVAYNSINGGNVDNWQFTSSGDNLAITSSLSSITSPAWIEGTVNLTADAVDIAVGDKTFGTIRLNGTQWASSANDDASPLGITLSADTVTDIIVNAKINDIVQQSVTASINWTPIDITQKTISDKYYIRKGDSLLFSVGSITGTLAEVDIDNDDISDYSFVPGSTQPILFNQAGEFVISAAVDGVSAGGLTLFVLNAENSQSGAMLIGQSRFFDFTIDPAIAITDAIIYSTDASVLNLTDPITNGNTVSLSAEAAASGTSCILIRLCDMTGPGLYVKPIDEFRIVCTAEEYVVFNDNDGIGHADFYTYPYIEGISIDLTMYASGATFGNGDYLLTIQESQFYENYDLGTDLVRGSTKFPIYLPENTDWYCFDAIIKIDGEDIGFYNNINGVPIRISIDQIAVPYNVEYRNELVIKTVKSANIGRNLDFSISSDYYPKPWLDDFSDYNADDPYSSVFVCDTDNLVPVNECVYFSVFINGYNNDTEREACKGYHSVMIGETIFQDAISVERADLFCRALVDGESVNTKVLSVLSYPVSSDFIQHYNIAGNAYNIVFRVPRSKASRETSSFDGIVWVKDFDGNVISSQISEHFTRRNASDGENGFEFISDRKYIFTSDDASTGVYSDFSTVVIKALENCEVMVNHPIP